MRIVTLLVVLFLLCEGCSNQEYKKKKIGKNIVEAQFIHDSLINGTAKFFDLDGNIESKANFYMGLKDGHAVNYYKNGNLKDSMQYENNQLNGLFYSYDSLGTLLFAGTYFRGLNIGDQFFYKKNMIKEYYFTNFEKKRIVTCLYDSVGNCYSSFFDISPVVSDVLIENQQPAINLFLYFPHPASFKLSYTLGLIDFNSQKHKEFKLNSDRLFIDTILQPPPKNLDYFISLKFENLKDSTKKIYLKKFRDSSNVN